MTTNNRLVFGSKEANDLLKKHKAAKLTNKINSELDSLISGVEEIGELIAGVRGSENRQQFQPKIVELLREVSYLQIDASCEWNICNELQETRDLLDDADYLMTKIKESIDNGDNESAIAHVETFTRKNPSKQVQKADSIISLLE